MKPTGSNAYQYLYQQIVIWLVYFYIMTINAVSAAKGISDYLAQCEIVTGRRLNLKHTKAGFGDYIEASTDEMITNDMKGRTYGCISLGTSGNSQGFQVCFDLETGRIVPCIIKVINDWGNHRKIRTLKTNWNFGIG